MKKLLSLCLALMLLLLCPLAWAAGEAVVDEAELLTDSEEAELAATIEEIRSEFTFDVGIVTVPSLQGATAQDYADDYYDYNGYGEGYGDDRDGMLLLLAMEEREYHISTRGYGIYAFTDYGLDEMEYAFVPQLSDGDYAGAFATFLDYVKDYLQQAAEGEPVDVYYEEEDYVYEPVEVMSDGEWALVCLQIASGHLWILLIVGIILALVIVNAMKNQLKSIRSQGDAQHYAVNGGLNLTHNEDIFLYSRTTRVRIQDDDDHHSSGGGGSSSHTSSSGASHGGSGGKF